MKRIKIIKQKTLEEILEENKIFETLEHPNLNNNHEILHRYRILIESVINGDVYV
jgi:hypothetical protein